MRRVDKLGQFDWISLPSYEESVAKIKSKKYTNMDWFIARYQPLDPKSALDFRRNLCAILEGDYEEEIEQKSKTILNKILTRLNNNETRTSS